VALQIAFVRDQINEKPTEHMPDPLGNLNSPTLNFDSQLFFKNNTKTAEPTRERQMEQIHSRNLSRRPNVHQLTRAPLPSTHRVARCTAHVAQTTGCGGVGRARPVAVAAERLPPPVPAASSSAAVPLLFSSPTSSPLSASSESDVDESDSEDDEADVASLRVVAVEAAVAGRARHRAVAVVGAEALLRRARLVAGPAAVVVVTAMAAAAPGARTAGTAVRRLVLPLPPVPLLLPAVRAGAGCFRLPADGVAVVVAVVAFSVVRRGGRAGGRAAEAWTGTVGAGGCWGKAGVGRGAAEAATEVALVAVVEVAMDEEAAAAAPWAAERENGEGVAATATIFGLAGAGVAGGRLGVGGTSGVPGWADAAAVAAIGGGYMGGGTVTMEQASTGGGGQSGAEVPSDGDCGSVDTRLIASGRCGCCCCSAGIGVGIGVGVGGEGGAAASGGACNVSMGRTAASAKCATGARGADAEAAAAAVEMGAGVGGPVAPEAAVLVGAVVARVGQS